MRFRFDPLLRPLANRCVFDENAPSSSVDERPLTHRKGWLYKRKILMI